MNEYRVYAFQTKSNCLLIVECKLCSKGTLRKKNHRNMLGGEIFALLNYRYVT